MLEELWECRFMLLAIVVMLTLLAIGFVDGQHRRSTFFADHKCRDISNGYICADGAVLQ